MIYTCITSLSYIRVKCTYDCVALKDEIQKKLDKMQEPPPVKQVKPLPKPDDAPRKKRGGRRYVTFVNALRNT